jgi:hypothetical protein
MQNSLAEKKVAGEKEAADREKEISNANLPETEILVNLKLESRNFGRKFINWQSPMSRPKKILLIIGILLVGGIAFFIYKIRSHTSDSHLSVIPKNAAAVFKIDIKKLAVKADPMKLMDQPGFKNPGTGTFSELISNPFETGIDPIENIYGFISKEGDHQVAALVFNVDDASKLQDFVNKLHIGSNDIVNESGIYFSEISETKCIAWNDDAGIMIATNSGEAKVDAKKYLEQTKENSIAANTDYKTFADKTFDMGLFFNNKELSQLSESTNSLTSLGLTDGHGELLLNFENDKISATYNNFSSTTNSTSILKSTGPNAKQFDAISTSPPLLYLGLSLDMKTLFSVLKSDPSMKDNLLGLEMGLNTSENELKTLISGDVSVSFTDFKDISAYDPRVGAMVDKAMKDPGAGERSDYALNTPICYISIGENDDAKMDTILLHSGLMKIPSSGGKNKENFYAMPGTMYIVYVAAKDGHLLITNDYYAADTLSTTGKLATTLPTEISKTEPLVFWTDLNSEHLPRAFSETLKDMYGDEAMQFYSSAVKPFQNIRLSGKGNGSELDIAIEPGEGNSLYRLLVYYGDLLK